jgi:hypothetical protein
VDTKWPHTIREINDLPKSEKITIYRSLVPDWVFPRFDIDPADFTSSGLIHVRCPQGSNAVELSVYDAPQATDPALYLHMGDSPQMQLMVLMVVVNDPSSPRFDIDRDEQGRPNQLGTNKRNISEEIRAMQAGLAPGQVRRGLRIFRSALPTFERFVGQMGHGLFFIEPLFYHNAIIFENFGFSYARGLQRMKTIHQEFLPSGTLHRQLDGSTPFRYPNAWKTVLGRSWAMHDGILEQPFTGIQMYKQVGKDANIQTFPNACW